MTALMSVLLCVVLLDGGAPTPAPEPVIEPKVIKVKGKASWHATGRDGKYAAACLKLRKALGDDWRGTKVVLRKRGYEPLTVILNDWCGSTDKLIDLSDEAFQHFRPLSDGVVMVRVRAT